MRTLNFTIKSREEVHEQFKKAFYAAQHRLPFKPINETSFTSIEALRNFLTPKRLELLKAIKETRPASVYALAKTVKRTFSSVHKDIVTLELHGLVKLDRRGAARKRSLHPKVDYGSINIRIDV